MLQAMEELQDNRRYVPFLKDTLQQCGLIVVDWFGKKSPDARYLNEVVSSNVNSCISAAITKYYPDHHIYTKGSTDNGEQDYEWICDPLDGAFIYTKGLKSVVISMTLVHRGVPVLTGILAPFSDDFYFAIKGGGVFKGDTPLSKITRPLEQYGMINAEWWPAAEYDVDVVAHDLCKAYQLYPIHIGSVVYSACLVAEGVLTASIFGGKLVGKNHEAAAVMLLMEEAGGRYTNLFGEDIGFEGIIDGFIISTKQAHPSIVEEARKILG